MLQHDGGRGCPRCLLRNAPGATVCRGCKTPLTDATSSDGPAPVSALPSGWSARADSPAVATTQPSPAGDGWVRRPSLVIEPAAPVEVGVEAGTSAKFLVSIALGLVTVAITIAILAGAATRIGYLLSNFTLFFIVPVGGVIAGGVAASGLAGGMRGLHVRPPAWITGVAASLGVVAFAGATYALYALTYVDDTLTVNHERRGEHISAFTNAETRAPITFLDWLKVDVAGRSASFLDSPSPSLSFDFLGSTASTINWALFGLEGLGFIVGAIGIIANVRDIPYCPTCRRYMATRRLATMPVGVLPGHWNRLNDAIGSRQGVALAISEAGAYQVDKKNDYVRLDVARCARCGRGELRAETMAGKQLEDHAKRLTRPLSADEAALVASP